MVLLSVCACKFCFNFFLVNLILKAGIPQPNKVVTKARLAILVTAFSLCAVFTKLLSYLLKIFVKTVKAFCIAVSGELTASLSAVKILSDVTDLPFNMVLT